MTWTYHRFSPQSSPVGEALLLAAQNKLSPEQARTAMAAIYHDAANVDTKYPILIYNEKPGPEAYARDLPLEWGHVQYDFTKGYDATLAKVCDLLNGKPLQLQGETITLNPIQASLTRCVTQYLPAPYLVFHYPKSLKENPMASDDSTTVAVFAHSNNNDVVVANIGKRGTRFAGTFIGRTDLYAWDFIMSVYTDKDAKLYVLFVAGDESIPTVQVTPHSVGFGQGASLGSLTYDPESGNLIINSHPAAWLQGALMGIFTKGG